MQYALQKTITYPITRILGNQIPGGYHFKRAHTLNLTPVAEICETKDNML